MRPLIVAVLACLYILLSGCVYRHDPRDVTRMPDYHWTRVTSTDEEGKNFDLRGVLRGESLVIPTIEGPGEIRRLWFTVRAYPEGPPRDLILNITWDGADGPSVRVPLWDFFGLGHGEFVEYENDFLAVTKQNSLNAFFPMPFRKEARIEITSDNPEAVSGVFYYVEYVKYPSERAMRGKNYFHAQYNMEKPATPGEFYTVLDTTGRGTFLGSFLTIGLNSWGWWGEGDDVFTIDGEETWGTGSEDYFGGAWGWNNEQTGGDRFGVPFVHEPKLRGGEWTVFRFHSEAPIPFRESFRLAFEHGVEGWDARPVTGNHYSSVAYYYLDTPQVQPLLPPLEDRTRPVVPLPTHRIGEWYQAEVAVVEQSLIPVRASAAFTKDRTELERLKFQGDAEALLVAYTSGARFAWAVAFEEGGTFSPEMRRGLAPNAFDYDLYLNGKPWFSGLSGYSEGHEIEVTALPAITVDPGLNVIEIIATGTDPRAQDPAIYTGIDSIRFLPTRDPDARDFRYRPEEPSAEDLLHHVTVFHEDDATSGVLDLVHNTPPQFDHSGDESRTAPIVEGPWAEARAVQLDGLDERLILDPEPFTQLRREWEIAAWIRPEIVEHTMAIFSRYMAVGAWYEAGKLALWMRDDAYRFHYMPTVNGLVPPRQWSHVRFSFDGKAARIFLNGALVKEDYRDGFGDIVTHPGRSIAGSSDTRQSGFSGAISDFRLYNRAVTKPVGELTEEE